MISNSASKSKSLTGVAVALPMKLWHQVSHRQLLLHSSQCLLPRSYTRVYQKHHPKTWTPARFHNQAVFESLLDQKNFEGLAEAALRAYASVEHVTGRNESHPDTTHTMIIEAVNFLVGVLPQTLGSLISGGLPQDITTNPEHRHKHDKEWQSLDQLMQKVAIIYIASIGVEKNGMRESLRIGQAVKLAKAVLRYIREPVYAHEADGGEEAGAHAYLAGFWKGFARMNEE